MAMELMTYRQDSYNSRIEELAAKEAAKAGFQSVETLLTMLTQNSPNTKGDIDCLSVADVAVTQFRKFISVLDRNKIGHARFRRGPVKVLRPDQDPKPEQEPKPEPKPELVNRLPPLPYKKEITKTISFAPGPTMSTSFISSLTGDTESCNEPWMSSSGFHITNMSQVSSSIGRAPLPAATLKRKCGSVNGAAAPNCGSRCHCSKKRKSRLKKVVRIPAISSKLADIPPDDFSWRKYGQKPIKGSPHPRGYYKCSTMRSCPARKHVERALDDPTMLIVTYEGEHSHSQSATKAPSPVVLESS